MRYDHEMHLLFVDESGTPPKRGSDRQRYFVVAGIIVPEASWRRLHDALIGMKTRRKLRGELKWRFFSEENDDARNPMRAMTGDQRNDIRAELCRIICADTSVKTMAVVTDVKRAY
ncbi:MAG: DUF3800 domain-containing protein, partial [Rhodospirillaceae bacterium]|nr:DUF3800 domain-containing protein [Rhodospirillaceae bacterium]